MQFLLIRLYTTISWKSNGKRRNDQFPHDLLLLRCYLRGQKSGRVSDSHLSDLDPSAVKKWLAEDYPDIASHAKQEKAEIHWGDETGIQTGANRVRGFAPKGQTPEVRLVAKKSHVSMISAITNGGKVRFMMYRDAMNSKLLITFMTRLTKDAGRKVFLILDNLRVHHSQGVNKWLEDHRD